MRPRHLVFDVNETMLDLSSLGETFAALFGTAAAHQGWFSRLLHTSVVVNATGEYRDFSTLAAAAFDATAAAAGIELPDDAWPRLAAQLATVEAHPDVAPGLEALRAAGRQLIALTNSSPAAVASQLAHAGIDHFFDHVLSVDAVHRYKPAPEPYLHAAAVAGAALEEMWMVACHDWDLAGAAAAGMATAFIARPGWPYSSVYPAPTVTVGGIDELAAHLSAE